MKYLCENPFPEEKAKIADWLLEQGGFEPPVSREVFSMENLRKC
jgi:hypothetical protein